jgi:enoyl-[acyl-carrier protein] reductase I
MGFLTNKKLLITGLLSNRSIAYGIAKAALREGASLAFSYAGGEKIEKRVRDLARDFDTDLVFPCDVGEDEEIKSLCASLKSEWGQLDGLVHSIAFAPREALSGNYLDSVTRESFQIAHDIISYSFSALAQAARPLMLGNNASLLALTYLGSQRAFPSYNVMGLAKASLEANVRYMAASLGTDNIRVNAISAGPIKTLAAAGIGSFSKLLSFAEKTSPLGRNVTTEEVGNAAAFLLSDLASGITGEITYVDAGFNTSGIAPLE